MTTALVLGAGGALGWVYHAGVVRALEERIGWDAGSADLVIGTSAGAAVAAGIRAGASPDDVVRSVARPPTAEERTAMREELRGAKRTFRPLAPHLARHALRGGNGTAIAVAGLLPPGLFPTSFLERFPGVGDHSEWPPGLWIPAVRADDGSTVVFGRDRTDIAVHEAVEASSAVPGMFRPKHIDGVAFVDGGMMSPTHADLAAEVEPDVVIISSPMTRPSRRPMARMARRRLAEERAGLRDRGIRSIVIEPGPEMLQAAQGFPRRNPGAAPEILSLAGADTMRAFASSGFSGSTKPS